MGRAYSLTVAVQIAGIQFQLNANNTINTSKINPNFFMSDLCPG
jgi:hypothetical protein